MTSESPPDDGLSSRVEQAAEDSGPTLATPHSRYLVVRAFDRVIEFAGAVTMLGITLVLFANAVMRYLFDSGLVWSSELTTSMVIWVAAIGMLISLRRGELLIVAVLTKRLSPRGRRYLHTVAALFSALAFSHLAWLGYDYVQSFGSDVTPYLRLPKGWFSSAIPIGIGLMAGGFFIQAVNVFQGRTIVGGSAEADTTDEGNDAR